MKRKVVLFCFVTLMLAVSLMACSSKKHKLNIKPIMGHVDNIKIDWDQVRSECEDVMISDDYPLVDYIDFAVSDDSKDKRIRLILPLKDNATQIESLKYGTEYIKMFNDIVGEQDFSIKHSGDNYYGGLWDEYKLELEVFREEDLLFPEKYFVNQIIESSSEEKDPVIPYISNATEEEKNTPNLNGFEN